MTRRAHAGPEPPGAPFPTWSLPGPLPGGGRVKRVQPPAAGLELERLVLDEGGANELLGRLRAAREALLERKARELARLLGGVGKRFLDPGDALCREALATLPAAAGLADGMAREVLRGMASDWRAPRLERLLDAELSGGAALDGFVPDAAAGRRVRALGPALTVHVSSGTVPGVSVTSMVRALLVKSAVLLKPGRGDEVLPVLFRRGLEEADPAIAAAAAVVYWPGGSGEALERVALAAADLVVAYGGDEAVRRVRSLARGTTPVVAYPHRVSFAVVGGETQASDDRLAQTASAAARAVALFDQRGCVSPHLFYVLGPESAAARFAAALADGLAVVHRELPPGALDADAASGLHQLRGGAELAAAAGRGRLWSGGEAPWTVVLETHPGFEPSCLGRAVRVKPAPSIETVLDAVRPFRRYLQTVGIADLAPQALNRLAEGLARLGAARVAPLESAPWPPPWWHHDGMGPLGPLVRWTDVEEG